MQALTVPAARTRPPLDVAWPAKCRRCRTRRRHSRQLGVCDACPRPGRSTCSGSCPGRNRRRRCRSTGAARTGGCGRGAASRPPGSAAGEVEHLAAACARTRWSAWQSWHPHGVRGACTQLHGPRERRRGMACGRRRRARLLRHRGGRRRLKVARASLRHLVLLRRWCSQWPLLRTPEACRRECCGCGYCLVGPALAAPNRLGRGGANRDFRGGPWLGWVPTSLIKYVSEQRCMQAATQLVPVRHRIGPPAPVRHLQNKGTQNGAWQRRACMNACVGAQRQKPHTRINAWPGPGSDPRRKSVACKRIGCSRHATDWRRECQVMNVGARTMQ